MKRILIVSLLACIAFSASIKSSIKSKASAQSAAGIAPSWWGKEDYDNHVYGCFASADAKASGSYDYKAAWNG
jgi:hypothetical protein